MRESLVIFVDDSVDELNLFAEVFGSEFDLVLGQSAEEALEQLGDRTPDLILLDVYIPEEGRDREVPPEIASKVLDLPPDRGELRQAYNNLVMAQERFQELQRARAHGVEGGLKLASIFAEAFPEIPLIGYSRKSSPLEMLRYLAEIRTACDSIQKPNDPRGWEETRLLTLGERSSLLSLFTGYIGSDASWYFHIRDAALHLLNCVDYARSHLE